MEDDITITPLHQPGYVENPLTEIARDGARRMLAAALRVEADAFVARYAQETLPDGRQRIVRHGYGPERSIQTGIGALRASCRPTNTGHPKIFPDLAAEKHEILRCVIRPECDVVFLRPTTQRLSGAYREGLWRAASVV